MTGRPGRAGEPVFTVTALVLAFWVALVGVVAPAGALQAAAAHPPPAASPGTEQPVGPAADSGDSADAVLTVHVRRVDPIIALPGRDVRVEVDLTNSGAGATTGPVRVQLRLGAADALLTRSRVRDFAAGGGGAGG